MACVYPDLAAGMIRMEFGRVVLGPTACADFHGDFCLSRPVHAAMVKRMVPLWISVYVGAVTL